MSKIGSTIKGLVFNVIHFFILGETGDLERKTGNTKKFTRSQEQRFKASRQLVTKANVWMLKISKGRLGNSFLGMPILLLTTIGRKSGKPRTQPVYFVRDGQRIVLVASNGGSPDNPTWLLNAQANPAVVIEILGHKQDMTFRVASAEEKAQMWPKLTGLFPMWQEVEDRSQRVFPVIILEPAE